MLPIRNILKYNFRIISGRIHRCRQLFIDKNNTPDKQHMDFWSAAAPSYFVICIICYYFKAHNLSFHEISF